MRRKNETHPAIKTRRSYDDPRYQQAIRELRKRDDPCINCGLTIDPQLRWPHPLSWSADHLIPTSKLPPNDDRQWHISNLAASHLRCNESRGNKTKTNPKPIQW